MQLMIVNCLIPQKNSIFLKGHIGIEQGKIKQIWFTENFPDYDCAQVIDAAGLILSPGFIDTHNHGGNGYGYNCDKNEWSNIEKRLSSAGVTSVLATWESSSIDETLGFLERIKIIEKDNQENNVDILGIHFEGPFLNKAMRGMHQEEFIRKGTKEEFWLILEKANGLVKIWSLAPEIKENMELIGLMAGEGISVSIAHTEADYNTALNAFWAGANRVTHIFNAMPVLNQRYTGVATAAWQQGAFIELIADNHHISPTIMKMFISAADKSKIVLVSDNNECSGLPEGRYVVHNRPLIVKMGRLEIESGGLAGSIVGLNQCALNVTHCGFSAWTALKMVTENPARSIGVYDRKGSIDTGKDADLVLLDEHFNVYLTIKGGRIVYRSTKEIPV